MCPADAHRENQRPPRPYSARCTATVVTILRRTLILCLVKQCIIFAQSFAREEEAYSLRARLADAQREAEAAAAGKARYKAAAAAAEASLAAKERERRALETLAQDLMSRQEALGAASQG